MTMDIIVMGMMKMVLIKKDIIGEEKIEMDMIKKDSNMLVDLDVCIKTVQKYDDNGYDINGYDENGFDSEGYDISGYDYEGFNKKA